MALVKGNPPNINEEGIRFPLLVSYAYLRKCQPGDREYILTRAKDDGFDVLLDSGAFSAANAGHEIGLDEYIAFLHQHKESFFAYIALDKLKDPVQTEKNLEVMLGEGLDPSPVHVLGDGQRRMDELFERSNLVFLGGLRRPGRGQAPKAYVAQKMKWSKGRDVHWLGLTSQGLIKAFTPYSCDCSSWGSAQRYGRCDVYRGKGHWWSSARGDRLKPLPMNVLWTIQRLGYTAADWTVDDNWKQNGAPSMVMEITTASWLRYIMEVRREFGTRIFLATALVGYDLLVIKRHWLNLREELSNG